MRPMTTLSRALLLSLAISGEAVAAPARMTLPWPESNPAAEGLDGKLIETMVAKMQAPGARFHALIIVKNGRLTVERYFNGFDREKSQNMYSIAKSFLSTLCGIAAGEGRLPDLGARLTDCLPPAYAVELRGGREKITLGDILTMRAGLRPLRGVDLAGVGDQLRAELGQDLVAEPGRVFAYSTGAILVASAVLRASVGENAASYGSSRLFSPLGIESWYWASDATGLTIGGTDLRLKAVDLARLGYLYLRKGDWFGTRVLPASWIEAATRTSSTPRGMNRAEDCGYGYLWWVDEWGGYSAHGAGGQFAFVVPRLDLVAVFTGDLAPEDFPLPHDYMQRYVLPAAERPTSR